MHRNIINQTAVILLMTATLFGSAFGWIDIQATQNLGQATWDRIDDTYRVLGVVEIRNDDTLRITEGVHVVFVDGASLQFKERAVLLAQGGPTDESRVELGPTEEGVIWGGIYFQNRSQDDMKMSWIHFALIVSAQTGIASGRQQGGPLVPGSSIDVRNCDIQYCVSAIEFNDVSNRALSVFIRDNVLSFIGAQSYVVYIHTTAQKIIKIMNNQIHTPFDNLGGGQDQQVWGIVLDGQCTEDSISNNVIDNYQYESVEKVFLVV